MTVFGCAYWDRSWRRARKDGQAMREVGFSWVNVPISEERMAFDREGTHDVVDALSDAGLEVRISPWGVARMFGGEGLSQAVGPADQPQIARDWLDKAQTLGADAIYWDEPKGMHGPIALQELTKACDRPQHLYWNPNVGVRPCDAVLERMASIGLDCYDGNITAAVDELTGLGTQYGKPTHVWVRAFRLDAATSTCPAACIERLVMAGVQDIAIWGWPSPGCSILDCDHPGKVWKGIMNAMAGAQP